MARIPTAANLTKVSPRSGPQIDFSSVARSGAARGAALKALGDTGSDIAIAEQRENNASGAQDRINKFASFKRGLLTGGKDDQGNPVQGYTASVGQEALNARPGIEQKLDEERKRLSGTATTDSMRRMFDKTSEVYFQDGLNSIANHSLKAKATVTEAVDAETIRQLRLNAVSYAGDDDGFEATKENITAAAAKTFQMNVGKFGHNVAKGMADQAETKINVAVITGFLDDGQPEKAEEYYKNITGDGVFAPGFSDAARGKMLKMITTEQHLKKTTDGVDSYAASVGGLNSPEAITRAHAANAADNGANPRLQKAIDAGIRDNAAATRAATIKRQQKQKASVIERMEKGELKKPSDIPRSIRGDMDEATLSLMGKAIRNQMTGAEPQHFSGAWELFNNLGDAGRNKMSVAEYKLWFRPHVDREHYDRGLEQLQATQAAAAGNELTPRQSRVLSTKEMVQTAMAGNGFTKPGAKTRSKAGSKRRSGFEDAVYRRIQSAERGLEGKALPRDAVQKIIDEEMIQAVFGRRNGA